MNAVGLIQLLTALNTTIPNLVNIVSHYGSLADSPELKETDRETMKKNLDKLKLPTWDNL